MGFIKAIGTAASSQYQDQFREVISYQNVDNSLLVKRIVPANGVIQDQSRLFVNPGQCAIYTDNGAIKDIITEPGMYFMDTSSPTLFQVNIFKGITEMFLTTMKRIAYEGQEINKQAVYFVSLTEKIGLRFGTPSPIMFRDPEWGPISVRISGTYALKINNPVNLLTNVVGDVYEYSVDNLTQQITSHMISEVSGAIGLLGVSFDQISTHQTTLATSIIEPVNRSIEDMGVELSQIAIHSVSVDEEIQESMNERVGIKMKATSVNNEEADIYTKLNTAEAVKDLANNSNSSGATIMGMNMGNTMAGMINGEINTANNNQNNQNN